MTIEAPKAEQIPDLRRLWKDVFEDSDQFLDSFFSLAFSPERCRCVVAGGGIKAALYWFDCCCKDEKFAYLYAVATAESSRGQGLCRQLMEHTHAHLRRLGYTGAILVPATDSLRNMYAGMGYLPGTTVTEVTCLPGEMPAHLQRLDAEEYECRRKAMLPAGAVVQQGEFTALLADNCDLYSGEGFLTAVYVDDGVVHAEELLGNAAAAPGILAALGATEGTFRIPGAEKEFAMYCPLKPDCPKPGYFGISFG